MVLGVTLGIAITLLGVVQAALGVRRDAPLQTLLGSLQALCGIGIAIANAAQ
jgi:hypothetical protein